MNKVEITNEKLEELKRLAEVATPGPWEALTNGVCLPEHNNRQEILGSFYDNNNTNFVAAANPQVVLALIAENERLRRNIEFQTTAMAEYKQAAKMAWGGEIPSPLPGHNSSEEKMIEQFEYLNCPSCGGSGHVGDCSMAIQNLKCDLVNVQSKAESLEKEADWLAEKIVAGFAWTPHHCEPADCLDCKYGGECKNYWREAARKAIGGMK